MKVCVLASGSKGNCTYIETKKAKFLIDIGTTSLYAERKLKEIGVDPKDIDGILITHTHTDHISGIRVFIKKYKTKLYLTSGIYKELMTMFPILEYQIINDDFILNDVHVEIFKTSHDAADSNGYIISCDKVSAVYITDTGYINIKNHNKLKNKELYIIESNHDVEMLMNGSYPYNVKQRILGDVGHLSNKDCSNYIIKFMGEKTKNIVLIHLSEENNTPEKALEMLDNTLLKQNKKVEHIYIAKQSERTDLIEV
ncbi:MAG: MBL fold metallo-hydrolase [Bacilli bacterium]|nr:MBL fold metallo-hydrolase [Bacilli bacterium]